MSDYVLPDDEKTPIDYKVLTDLSFLNMGRHTGKSLHANMVRLLPDREIPSVKHLRVSNRLKFNPIVKSFLLKNMKTLESLEVPDNPPTRADRRYERLKRLTCRFKNDDMAVMCTALEELVQQSVRCYAVHPHLSCKDPLHGYRDSF